MMTRLIRVLAGTLAISTILPLAHAVSKDAQELMTLREKHAPSNCEMTKLYLQLGEARQAKDQARAQTLTERMQALDKKLSADHARMKALRKRIRNTTDYRAVLEQQVKFDKACNRPTDHR